VTNSGSSNPSSAYLHQDIPSILSDVAIPSQGEKVIALFKEVTLINQLYGDFKARRREISSSTNASFSLGSANHDPFLWNMGVLARTAANIHLETSVNALNAIYILVLDGNGRPRGVELYGLAIASLCRVALENSLMCLWNLGNGDISHLAKSGLAECIKNLGYQIGVEEITRSNRSIALGSRRTLPPSEKLLRLESELIEVKHAAVEMGLASADQISPDPPSVSGFRLKTPIPDYMRLCKDTEVGIFKSLNDLYSRLSGLVHGLIWIFEEATTSDSDSPGIQYEKRFADLNFMVQSMMVAIECTWRAKVRYLETIESFLA
jgi:hypothetical protein